MMLSSNKNKQHELMILHRGAAGGGSRPDFKNLFSESPIHLVFLPEIAPTHPRARAPDVPLSVWYEAKGSKHLKGKAMMLSSNKNKQHESMIFHRGRKGGRIPGH